MEYHCYVFDRFSRLANVFEMTAEHDIDACVPRKSPWARMTKTCTASNCGKATAASIRSICSNRTATLRTSRYRTCPPRPEWPQQAAESLQAPKSALSPWVIQPIASSRL